LNFDPQKTLTVVAAYPDGRMDPSLFWFFNRHGLLFDEEHIAMTNIRDPAIAKNIIIKNILLPSDAETFIVVDNDIGFLARTDPFLDADFDLTCVVCNNGHGPAAWKEPGAFHAGLWRTHREVLEKTLPPWFRLEYSQDGTKVKRCLCMHFADKVKSMGFTVGHAGFAHHDP